MSYPAGPPDPYDSPAGRAAAQYPPPQPTGDNADDFLISLLVAAILSGWVLSKVRGILLRFQSVNAGAVAFLLRQDAIIGLLQMDDYSPTNPMLAAARRQNAFRRAAYLVASTRRMSAVTETNDPNKVAALWSRELNYLAAHLQATRKRNVAAIQVAKAWTLAGKPALLGWFAIRDSKTTVECLAAHGRNFDPMAIPPFGYPGASHPNCRCQAVRPWDTDLRVEDLPDPRMMFDGVVAASNRTVWRLE